MSYSLLTDMTVCLHSCVSVEEIEQMTSLFHQKQRELLVAAARVEELGDQLEALRSNKLETPFPHHHDMSSTAELERLYRELQVKSQTHEKNYAYVVIFFKALVFSTLNMTSTCDATSVHAATVLFVFTETMLELRPIGN